MAKTSSREEKGRELHRSGKVEFMEGSRPEAGGEFVVGGSNGKSYEVYLDIRYRVAECECEDFRRNRGQRCKHIIAAYLERERLMADEARIQRAAGASEATEEMALF